MQIAARPAHEAERLELLDALRILDTAPEPFFDHIAELARTITGVKVAMVAMVDDRRKWLKSCSGGALGESDRDIAFCSHTILQDEVMWVEDSRLDPRFWDNPLVTGPKRLNFYAGAPIIVSGFKIGTLCLNDETPRAYDPQTAETLQRLAAMVASQLEGRRLQLMGASVLAASKDAIICADAEARIIFWNPAAGELFGYAEAEALGRELSLLAPRDLSSAEAAGWGRALNWLAERRAEQAPLEFMAARRDGSRLPVEVTCAEWEDGDRPALSLIIRDCTERRRAAEDIRQALVKAEAASHAKSAFLANMSHEIRTPLNGVLGMAQILGMEKLTPAQAEGVAVIQQSGDDLMVILDQVLDTAQIEAGQVQLERTSFDLQQLLANACDAAAVLARHKGLRFEVHAAADAHGPWVGDAGRLKQILRNLASNAVKFTAVGEIRVEASTAAGAYDTLLVRVSDTGIGIDEAVAPRLFKKFVQADASTTRQYGGSGLGLSICRELVELFGGDIGLESRPSGGSRFWFSVPLERGGRQLQATAA